MSESFATNFLFIGIDYNGKQTRNHKSQISNERNLLYYLLFGICLRFEIWLLVLVPKMKCPFCSDQRNKVIDSRLGKDGVAIRRRRECLECKRRFTTYERVEEVDLLVVKKDGRREPFDRHKILDGMLKACEKRPISVNIIQDFVSELERELQEKGEREVDSREVGERVIKKLYELDEVAYVRFASVYRSFKDINHFMEELKDLLKDKEKESTKLTEKVDVHGPKPALELIKGKSEE